MLFGVEKAGGHIALIEDSCYASGRTMYHPILCFRFLVWASRRVFPPRSMQQWYSSTRQESRNNHKHNLHSIRATLGLNLIEHCRKRPLTFGRRKSPPGSELRLEERPPLAARAEPSANSESSRSGCASFLSFQEVKDLLGRVEARAEIQVQTSGIFLGTRGVREVPQFLRLSSIMGQRVALVACRT